MNTARIQQALDRIEQDDHLLRQALAFAAEHREHCPGKDCTIMLSSLAILLRRAGIELTHDDARKFM